MRSWVGISPGAGLFSSLFYSISSVSIIKVPHGGATLLIFLFSKIYLAAQLEAKQAYYAQIEDLKNERDRRSRRWQGNADI